MIFETLEFLRLHLNQYVIDTGNNLDDANPVLLTNVSTLESTSNGGEIDSRLNISLVNINEEFTLKNQPAVRQTLPRPSYQNPPILLNLFMLVSASHADYPTALKMLSLAVAFFQSKNTFTYSDAPPAASTLQGATGLGEDIRKKLKIKLDLYSLTFEQLNHLWGTLGGKQYPFALYKIRVVEIDADQKVRGGGYIEEIDLVNS